MMDFEVRPGVKEQVVPAEDLENVVETVAHKKAKKIYPVRCPRCGSEYLKRLKRRGFLQGKLYAIFGYYPWRCTKCLGDFTLNRRGASRRHPTPTPKPIDQ